MSASAVLLRVLCTSSIFVNNDVMIAYSVCSTLALVIKNS